MTVPRIRQLVLLVPDLETALAEVREVFGFTQGIRDVEEMAKLGFEHEICSFADTFLEICAPLGPEWSHARLVEKRGPMGYMVDVQVEDLEAVVARAAELDIAPLFKEVFNDSLISQWHPRALGTLAEFDQIEPAETWHYAPRIFANAATGVATDMVGAEIAVADPVAMTATWAAVLGVTPSSETTLDLSGSTLRFTEGTEGFRGIDVAAADPARVGETVHLLGIDVHFVEGAAR